GRRAAPRPGGPQADRVRPLAAAATPTDRSGGAVAEDWVGRQCYDARDEAMARDRDPGRRGVPEGSIRGSVPAAARGPDRSRVQEGRRGRGRKRGDEGRSREAEGRGAGEQVARVHVGLLRQGTEGARRVRARRGRSGRRPEVRRGEVTTAGIPTG